MVRVLGILGGMGPAAAADFFAKVVAATEAACDQAHIPTVVWSDPRIPDRTCALIAGDASPLPGMRRGLAVLESAGAQIVAIACNTAHRWHVDLAARSRARVLHIAAAAAREAAVARPHGGRVAILATQGTLRAGFYGPVFAARGLQTVRPPPRAQAAIGRAIALAKSGALVEGAAAFENALVRVAAIGVDTAVMACTELPLLAAEGRSNGVRLIDASAALARAAVTACGARVRRVRRSGAG